MSEILYSEKHDKIFLVHTSWGTVVEVEHMGELLLVHKKYAKDWIYLGDL
jgi:hypothetical protein